MKRCRRSLVLVGLLVFIITHSYSPGKDRPFAPEPKPTAPSTSKLKNAIAEMPSRTRKAMSAVVGWSPIYDIEKVPLSGKNIYQITFDHQGYAAVVFIDEAGEVLGDPAVK
jgi:hypothetical protein